MLQPIPLHSSDEELEDWAVNGLNEAIAKNAKPVKMIINSANSPGRRTDKSAWESARSADENKDKAQDELCKVQEQAQGEQSTTTTAAESG